MFIHASAQGHLYSCSDIVVLCRFASSLAAAHARTRACHTVACAVRARDRNVLFADSSSQQAAQAALPWVRNLSSTGWFANL